MADPTRPITITNTCFPLPNPADYVINNSMLIRQTDIVDELSIRRTDKVGKPSLDELT